METKHHHHLISEGLHLGFAIAKLALKAAGICAAFMTVHELHKLHKGLEEHHKATK